MARIEHSVVINRPASEVWAALRNPEDMMRWRTELKEIRTTSQGSFGVGSTYVEVERFLGHDNNTMREVTAFEENKNFSFKSISGPIPEHGAMTLEPVSEGTRFTIVLDFQAGGFFKLAEPIVVRLANKQMQANMGVFKEVLEAQS